MFGKSNPNRVVAARKRPVNRPYAKPSASGINATAKVFDPDPRTRLQDANLHKSAENAKDIVIPENAYETVILRDVTQHQGQQTLKGVHAKLVDFAEPTTTLPTRSNANFSVNRGHDDFVDIMAYYHIDAAQRHLQALGYVGDKRIIDFALPIDAHATHQDNSFYSSMDQRIGLGSGVNPDGEDADVIWHEYGHAIHFFINPLWDGGDSGAIGEGFSDYLAASHSLRTPNGHTFEPNLVFNWEAQFSNWSPRTLNDQTASYNPNFTYPAHYTVNGTNADQLWSTPLFQAMHAAEAEALAKGQTASEINQLRDDFDRLILESHFGLGPDIKMPQMALMTIDTAKRLYPNKNYHQHLRTEFGKRNLIEEPLNVTLNHLPESALGVWLISDQIQPLKLTLHNSSDNDLTDLHLMFDSSQLDWIESEVRLAKLAAQTEQVIELKVKPNVACGKTATSQLQAKYQSASPVFQDSRFQLTTPIGEPIWLSATTTQSQPLEDAKGQGGFSQQLGITKSSLLMPETDQTINDDLEIALHLTHQRLEQREIQLIAPSGQRVMLWNKGYFPEKEFELSFPNQITPHQALSVLNGSPLQGKWQLEITDYTAGQTGQLVRWQIRQANGQTCPPKSPAPTSSSRGGSLDMGLMVLLLLMLFGKQLFRKAPVSTRAKQWWQTGLLTSLFSASFWPWHKATTSVVRNHSHNLLNKRKSR